MPIEPQALRMQAADRVRLVVDFLRKEPNALTKQNAEFLVRNGAFMDAFRQRLAEARRDRYDSLKARPKDELRTAISRQLVNEALGDTHRGTQLIPAAVASNLFFNEMFRLSTQFAEQAYLGAVEIVERKVKVIIDGKVYSVDYTAIKAADLDLDSARDAALKLANRVHLRTGGSRLHLYSRNKDGTVTFAIYVDKPIGVHPGYQQTGLRMNFHEDKARSKDSRYFVVEGVFKHASGSDIYERIE